LSTSRVQYYVTGYGWGENTELIQHGEEAVLGLLSIKDQIDDDEYHAGIAASWPTPFYWDEIGARP
jgi:hypothetical protein